MFGFDEKLKKGRVLKSYTVLRTYNSFNIRAVRALLTHK